MKFSIRNIFSRKKTITTGRGVAFLSFGTPVKVQPFADVIFLNIGQLLTDLCNDVTFRLKSGDAALFDAFTNFFADRGQMALDMLFHDGVVVLEHTQVGEGIYAAHSIRLMKRTEYTVTRNSGDYIVQSIEPNKDVQVITSATFELLGMSDYEVLQPYLSFLNNVMNASNTVSARLGSLIVATPTTPSGASAPASLEDWERKEIEKEIRDNYGALAEQSQFLLFGQDMKLQTVNLAGLDQRTGEKAKMAILAIADRLKVPANQIGIIDANSSKSLSNGTELREGDFNKYQSFERLLNRTFVRLAQSMGMVVDYDIYNKPIRQIQQGI